MTSYIEMDFLIAGPLWRESAGHRRIPPKKDRDVEILWCLYGKPWQAVEQPELSLEFRNHDSQVTFRYKPLVDTTNHEAMPVIKLCIATRNSDFLDFVLTVNKI